MRLKCVAIDDDELSLMMLEEHVKNIDFLELSAKFNNAADSYEFIQEENVDLIFLDIEMPNLSGFDFLKSLAKTPMIVVVSGNPLHAVEGFEFNICDFLLKPIRKDRFMKTAGKILQSFKSKEQSSKRLKEQKFIFVKDHKKMVKIHFKNIRYLEGLKDYVKIVCTDKTVITKNSIGFFETVLNMRDFVRVHKSFIVAASQIDSFDSVCVEIGGKEIPIGRAYKSMFNENSNFTFGIQQQL